MVNRISKSLQDLIAILLALLARSGLPESPKNRVSPVKTYSSSPATIQIDSNVCPGVLNILS